MHGQTPRWECPHFFRHILCVGKNAHNIRGENNAYYAWAKTLWECPLFFTRILCVGKNAHNISGKNHAYYAWAKTVGMPTHKMRILCVGKNAHNIRGKNAYYAWARILCMGKCMGPRWECPRIKCAFYVWEKMRIIYVGKTTHIMHGQTHGGHAHIFPTHFMRGKKCA